jgi:hypothetical protein
LVPKRELVGPGRNCFHESFLALQLGDKMKTGRAWKELPLSILPGPTGWCKKKEIVGPGRNSFHESFLALQVEERKELPLSILPGPTGWCQKENL